MTILLHLPPTTREFWPMDPISGICLDSRDWRVFDYGLDGAQSMYREKPVRDLTTFLCQSPRTTPRNDVSIKADCPSILLPVSAQPSTVPQRRISQVPLPLLCRRPLPRTVAICTSPVPEVDVTVDAEVPSIPEDDEEPTEIISDAIFQTSLDFRRGNLTITLHNLGLEADTYSDDSDEEMNIYDPIPALWDYTDGRITIDMCTTTKSVFPSSSVVTVKSNGAKFISPPSSPEQSAEEHEDLGGLTFEYSTFVNDLVDAIAAFGVDERNLSSSTDAAPGGLFFPSPDEPDDVVSLQPLPSSRNLDIDSPCGDLDFPLFASVSMSNNSLSMCTSFLSTSSSAAESLFTIMPEPSTAGPLPADDAFPVPIRVHMPSSSSSGFNAIVRAPRVIPSRDIDSWAALHMQNPPAQRTEDVKETGVKKSLIDERPSESDDLQPSVSSPLILTTGSRSSTSPSPITADDTPSPSAALSLASSPPSRIITEAPVLLAHQTLPVLVLPIAKSTQVPTAAKDAPSEEASPAYQYPSQLCVRGSYSTYLSLFFSFFALLFVLLMITIAHHEHAIFRAQFVYEFASESTSLLGIGGSPRYCLYPDAGVCGFY